MAVLEAIAQYQFYIYLALAIISVGVTIHEIFVPERRAYFYDNKGLLQGVKKFKKKDKTIEFNKGRYNIDFRDGFVHTEKRLGKIKYYKFFYYTGNSNPFRMGTKLEPEITPELYDIMMESKIARDLNDFARKGLGELLKDPKVIVMILIGIAVIWYFGTGGTLTGSS